ncbi:MAG: hypothetical protein JWO95_624 [Verrucomicrobiales bacterium]|nr:hypothetical protein [Verrucomicrobiales bacterium]
MKHRKNQDQFQKPVSTARSAAIADPTTSASPHVTTVEEVSRKAYFIYLNQGSPQGREMDHWLSAEAELIADAKPNQPALFS